MKKCMEYEVVSRPRGRPKRTWREVAQKDCQANNLNKEDKVDKAWMVIRVSEWMNVFLVLAHPGSLGQREVKRLLLCRVL